MMASIPNMRSAPLPAPAGTGTPAAEPAPGDFAARMPAPRQPPEAVTLLPEAFVDPMAASEPSPGTLEPGDGDDTADTKTETPGDDQPAPALVVPFLPTQPMGPGSQVPATVSGTGDASVDPATLPVPAGKVGRPPRDAGGEKAGLSGPAATDPSLEPVKDLEIEAAVKELIQRKQALAKQAGATPAKAAQVDTAKSDAPVQAQTQSPAPAITAAIQAPVTLPTAELPPPVLAALDPQPVPAKATGTVEGTRTTDLAVERQLDLARDTEWLDRLARDIARAGSNDGPLRFRLHPQTLGHLQVELQQGDHGTAVRLTVETEAARQILADAQPRLTAEARAQGVRISETHVDLSGSGRQAPGDQRRQDEARQTPLIRTALGAGTDALPSARSSGRARLDRYA